MVNSKLEEFKKYVKGRRVAFIGVGVSNVPAMKYLNRLGAEVVGFDKKTPEQLGDICIELESLGIKLSLGEKYLETLIGFDLIFRSPSARPDLKEIARETKMGAILTSEIEMVMDMCPGKVIGITGSGGKTTTTTLIHEMLKEQGVNCYLGGNIGIPLFDKIEEMKEDSIIVLEMSSFQLMTMKTSPHIAVMTNLAPDHLDVHKDLEEYYNSKKNIFKYQNEDDILIVNYDNQLLRDFSKEATSKVLYFSDKAKFDNGIMVDEGTIKLAENKIRKHLLNVDQIKMIGEFNVMNLCAAILAVNGLVSYENIIKVATTFKGVEHRMEIIAEKNGVTYINNAIASSPIKATAGIEGFKEKIILIAGGSDKFVEFDDFAKVILDKVKILVLVGQTKEKIKSAVLKEKQLSDKGADMQLIECTEFDEAVLTASKMAKSGDYVVLSPGCASFDFFKNYKEKGNRFRKIVESI